MTTLLAVAAVAALLVVAAEGRLVHKGGFWEYKDPSIETAQSQIMVGEVETELTNTDKYNVKHGNKFVGTLLASNYSAGLVAGQEVRMVVTTAFLANLTQNPEDPLVHANFLLNSRLSLFNMHNYSLFPAFNVSGVSNVRVRVIAAYASRTTYLGTPVACRDGSSHDIWAEYWGMGPRNRAWGSQMVYSGFITFTVPPFDFRFCVKDVTRHNRTSDGQNHDLGLNVGWMEFINWEPTPRMPVATVFRFREPIYMWQTDSTLYAGDYSAIKIYANVNSNAGNALANVDGVKWNPKQFSLRDNIKIVPFGFPCTYEKSGSQYDMRIRSDNVQTTREAYCGSNQVDSSGIWVHATCMNEGAIAEGLLKTGSNRQNPASTSTTPSGYISGQAWFSVSETLVGYGKLPAAGQYDVCVSPRPFRMSQWNASVQNYNDGQGPYVRDGHPVWFKAYAASSSSCSTLSTGLALSACLPRSTALVTTTNPNTAITWSMSDMTHGTWGEIKFTGSSLDYTPATAWDHSATREYADLAGGDQFRIVPEEYFTAVPQTTFGDLYMDSTGTRLTKTIVTTERSGTETTSSVNRIGSTYTTTSLTTTNEHAFKQYHFADPGLGSQANDGCWWGGNDNYGSEGDFGGTPSTQCCGASAPCSTASFCTMSDTTTLGANAASDMGGNPRTAWSPWTLDSTGTNAWGYIRLPQGGSYRVCYRQPGGNWRVITQTSLTSNYTFKPTMLNSGYTYHVNDSRAETWGPVVVTSLSGSTLDMQDWNFYADTTSTVVGSALKVVMSTESCYVASAQTYASSWAPGSAESATSAGSADDSTTATQSIYFYIRIPKVPSSTSLRYRFCFRKGENNWHHIADPNYVAHTYMTQSDQFYPLPKPMVAFTLSDNSEGSYGKFIFMRDTSYTGTTNPLNAEADIGDRVRLVMNESSTGLPVFCDLVGSGYTGSDAVKVAQQVTTYALNDLGMYCAASSGTSTDPCYTGKLTPTAGAGSVNGYYPYTNVDPTSSSNNMASTDGTVGFITVPPRVSGTRPLGYRVCYKQAHTPNWVEATSVTYGQMLTVLTGSTFAFASQSTGISGAYGYVEITSTGSDISWSTDVIKLVPSAQTCSYTAAGTASYNQEYVTMTGANADTLAVFVDATNSTQIAGSKGVAGTTATARAYWIWPTITGRTRTTSTYRLCYMSRSTTSIVTQNWHSLSTSVSVDHYGVVFTLLQDPFAYGMLQVEFLSSASTPLNTNSGGDSAKLVQTGYACIGGETFTKPTITSATATTMYNSAEQTEVTDLGAGDEDVTTRAVLTTVVPSTTKYKICYKLKDGVYFEVGQADAADRVVSQSTSDISASASALSSTGYSIGSYLMGQTTYQSTYASGVAYSSHVVGGASARGSGSQTFYIVLASSEASSQTDTVKFVRTHVEAPAGTYTQLTKANCFSDGVMQQSLTTTAGTVYQHVYTTMPLEGGRYLVCYKRAGTSIWYQAYTASNYGSSTLLATFTVIPNLLGFESDATGTQLTVYDYNTNGTDSYGGLVAADYVYYTNSTGVCGYSAAFSDVGYATASVVLNSSSSTLSLSDNATDTVAKRSTEATLDPPTASIGNGYFKVCLFRTQSASTNASTTTAHFIKSGWYHVGNVGTLNGAGTPFFAPGGATALSVACGVYNDTYKLRSGRTYSVKVTTVDASGNAVKFATGTYAHAITASATNSHALQNYGPGCLASNAATYGYTARNLNQFAYGGAAEYKMTIESGCPSGGCTFKFSSTGLTDSSECKVDVFSTSISSIKIVSAPTTCTIGASCVVRAAAVHSDGEIAYTATDSATITVSGANGYTQSGSTSGSFANGYVTFTLSFAAETEASIAATSTVSVTVTANSVTSSSSSFSIYKPVLSTFHIVDVYPVIIAGMPIDPFNPGWEPTTSTSGYTFFHGGVLSAVEGSATLTAYSGYHFVAGQFYTVRFRAVGAANSVDEYITTSNLMPSANIAVTSTIDSANSLINGASCSAPGCTGTLTSTGSSTSPTPWATFAFKNAKGCTIASPCVLTFTSTWGTSSTATATITSPVRAVARKLTWVCGVDSWATSLTTTEIAAGSSTACPSAAVSDGWFVQVTAVDYNGDTDEFHQGSAFPVFAQGGVADGAGHWLTTVDMLTSGWNNATLFSASFSSGVALFRRLTLNRPCAAGVCNIEIMSTWGANIVSLGSLTATANTAGLSCGLNKVLGYCTTDSSTPAQCTTFGGLSDAWATHADSLIYKDTQICMNVSAVTSAGVRTLYETNWVHYYAIGTDDSGGSVALTLTDDQSQTTQVKRYRKMVNSYVNFCFKVGGTFTSRVTFNVYFVPQQFSDSGYWANSIAPCSVGPLSVWPTKLVAGVQLSSATGVTAITTGASSTLAVERTSSSSLAVTLGFTTYDHYGNAIATSDISSFHQYYTVKPIMDSTSSYLTMTNKGAVALRGQLNATEDTTATQANISSTVTYTLNLLKYCLGCTATFKVYDETGTAMTIMTVASPSTAVEVSASIDFYVINSESTVKRMVAFTPSTSPLTSYWVNGTASYTSLAASSPAVLHQSSCYGSSCMPKITSMLIPMGAAAGSADKILRSSTRGISMAVFVAEEGASLDSVLEPPGTYYGDVAAHLDILNSFTVSVSVGSQTLTCDTTLGNACTNDGTTSPKQTVSAFGSSLTDAVTAFSASSDWYVTWDYTSATTKFSLTGASSSNYVALNYDDTLSSGAPSMAGEFSASATHSSLSVESFATTGRVFAWRPPKQPLKLTVVATGADVDEVSPTQYDVYNTASNSFNGSAMTGPLSEMAFSYASQAIPVGVTFPITAEAVDGANLRVQTASGTVAVTTSSWSGCNNGGDKTFSGTMVNGRVTIMASFSTPCQSCVLKFVLTPSTSQTDLYSAMSANPISFTAYSSAFTITGTAATATHVAITSTTPETLLQNAATAATVADSFTLNLAVRGNVGYIPVATSESATAVVYNRYFYSSNLYYYGNGGVARAGTGSSLRLHHTAQSSFSGTGSVSWMFTKTCATCYVAFGSQVSGASSAVWKNLGTVFTVTTAQSSKTFFGYVPKQVPKGGAMSFTLWHTGSEESTIGVAGVASSAASSTSTVAKAAVDITNGNGGILDSAVWSGTSQYVEIHRVSFSAPCDNCSLTAGSNKIYVSVHTAATHLRPIYATQGTEHTVTSVGSTAYWDLQAVDDLGAYDITFGAKDCNFGGDIGWCPTTSASVSTALSNNGTSAGSFPQTDNTFLFAATTAVTTSSGEIINGRGNTTILINSPVRYTVPIFTATYSNTGMPVVASRTVDSTTAASFGVTLPHLTASVGTTSLELNAIAVSDKTKVSTEQAFIVDVALVGAMSGDVTPTNRYVAAEADNSVTITTTDCPTLSSSSTVQLVRGYVRAELVFTGSAATACSVTFTTSDAMGTGKCTTCAVTISSIVVTAVTASSWAFVRPSTWDNGVGSNPGLLYGSAGRRSIVAAALYGSDANGNTVRVSTCTGCTMTVSMAGAATGAYASCGFSPSSGASSSFDSTGMASGEITWNDAGVSSYLCSMTTTVTDAAGVTIGTAVTADVTICRPSQVVMVTNSTNEYRGMFLKTGVPYEFYAMVADSTGAQCRGDSQDDATQLTIDAVTPGAIAIASTVIGVVNVNQTAVDTTAYGAGWTAPRSNTVLAVGGAFKFLVMFTNSTYGLGLSGIRVRVTATSSVPAISSPSNVALSGTVETKIHASALRFHPATRIPRYVVTTRTMNTSTMSEAMGVALTVQAVDALNPSWASTFASLAAAPNVARRTGEPGNALGVEWSIKPRTLTGVLPFTFGTGSASTTLSMGETTWENVAYTGADGMYTASVNGVGTTPSVTPATATFFAQKLASIRLNTTMYSTSSSCTANCVLPNNTFTAAVNATINSGLEYLTTTSLTPFYLDMYVADSMGRPVMGDHDSVVAVTLNADTVNTNLRMGVPDGYVQTGTVYARAMGGKLRFKLGFLGSTVSNRTSMEHTLASLTFSCPSTRPLELRKPGEAAANPCTLSSMSSKNIMVHDIRASPAVFNSPEVVKVIKTIKFRALYTDVAFFNMSRFHSALGSNLRGRGFSYVTRANTARVAHTIACGVIAAYLPSNDFRPEICAGDVCDVASGSKNCPSSVRGCLCPGAAARPTLLNRYLLDMTNVTAIAVELTYNLSQAEGFRGTDVESIKAGYESIQDETLTALQSGEFAAFAVDANAVSGKPINEAGVFPTPEPTPAPSTPVPSGSAGSGSSVSGSTTTGASTVSFAFAFLLAAVMALLTL